MTNDNNERRFMEKLRAKLAARETTPHPGIRRRSGHDEASPDADELVRHFMTELSAVGGRAARCADPDELTARLTAVCVESDVRTIVLEPDSRWNEPGFAPWRRALDDVECEFIISGAGNEHVETVERADAGLTIADFGIAETGTVGFSTGPGRSRLTSLLPLVHFVLLPAATIMATRTEALEKMRTAAGRDGWPSQSVFITGPSRTGDIEGELTVGVHGPGLVGVFII